MKRFFLILFLSLSFVKSSFAVTEIFEVFTESHGNNKYEAKIKAIDLGSYRAFQLFANKLLIKDKKLKNIPYPVVRDAVLDVVIKDEKYEEYGTKAYYKATLDVKFTQLNAVKILLEYGSAKTLDKFSEAIVIPVFKINNILEISENEKHDWITLWKRWRADLPPYKLSFPKLNKKIKDKLDVEKILTYSYSKFVELLDFKLYKKVILPVGEYFTNKKSGESYIKVRYYIKDLQGQKILQKKYDLNGVRLSEVEEQIIKDFIKEFGRKETKSEQKTLNSKDHKSFNLLEKEVKQKGRVYKFALDPTYVGEIDDIQNKLFKVKGINFFRIVEDIEYNYQVNINADLDIEELTRILYNARLSFYYDKNKVPILFNVKDKVREL